MSLLAIMVPFAGCPTTALCVGGGRFGNQIIDVFPEGDPSPSPGLPVLRLPWVVVARFRINPNGVVAFLPSQRYRSSQGHNPVGVGVSFVPRTQGSRQSGNPGLSDISPSGKDKPAIST